MVLAEQKHCFQQISGRTMHNYTCTSCLQGFQKFPSHTVDLRSLKLLAVPLRDKEIGVAVKIIARPLVSFSFFFFFSQERSRDIFLFGFHNLCVYIHVQKMKPFLGNHPVVYIGKMYKLKQSIGEIDAIRPLEKSQEV